ncbi:hypothetical protein HGM15179_009517 [Zosterops borbonicus]|uniref:Uncharacterized protein n=1 Tax=Zosterops borbonicus TaxID=364589 RepID=A0A8K1GGB4_9PASS|nr:hypothetical protein HGM15179_009517 [Zosterops borbonicus]
MVMQTVTLQPMEVYSETEIHLKSLDSPLSEQVDSQRRLQLLGKPVLGQAPGRTCGTMERGAHTGAGFLTGLVTLQRTCSGAVHKELQPMARTHIGKVHGRLYSCNRDSFGNQHQCNAAPAELSTGNYLNENNFLWNSIDHDKMTPKLNADTTGNTPPECQLPLGREVMQGFCNLSTRFKTLSSNGHGKLKIIVKKTTLIWFDLWKNTSSSFGKDHHYQLIKNLINPSTSQQGEFIIFGSNNEAILELQILEKNGYKIKGPKGGHTALEEIGIIYFEGDG